MKHITEKHEIVPAELEAGDVVIFHSNTLHRSAQNRSEHRRWTFLFCYNRVDNDTVTKTDDRFYVKLDKVPDNAIKQAGLKLADGSDGEHFTSKPFVPKVRESADAD